MPRNFSDEYIRHQFYVVGLGNGQADAFIDVLNETHEPVTVALLSALPSIIGTRAFTHKQTNQIKAVTETIQGIRDGATDSFRFQFENYLRDLVGRELKYNVRQFESLPEQGSIVEPPEDKTARLLLLMVPYVGLTIDEWFTGFKAGDIARVEAAIKAGLSNDLTASEIVTTIVGSKNLGWKNGILATSTNAARTLARTVTVGVANQARSMFSMANGAAVAKERYTAILDGRTTVFCADEDGKLYDVGTGPMPPVHRNCRSSRVPIPAVMMTPDRLGTKGTVRDTRTKKERNKDFRADAKRRTGGDKWKSMDDSARNAQISIEKANWVKENVGSVPANMTWKEWFRRQPSWFQRDYLGGARYSSWKAGRSTIADYAAPSARGYTVAELVSKGVL